MPDSKVIEFVESTHKLRMFDFSGTCKKWMADTPRKKREYHPSEKKAIAQIEKRYFSYLPNPSDEEHSNEYLELFELPHWFDDDLAV